MNERLVNQCAFLMAREILGTLGECIGQEQQRAAFELFFKACKDAINQYESPRERMQKRLNPLAA